ncbi:MAG: MtrB/PioB family outer membrane beta-barrel protein, partial [Nitrospirae bacterium]|nr:MtrB/PioB family outer membrane beta-barrel protein [Nitrospirota bacterium]
PQYSDFTTPINGIIEDTNSVYIMGLNLDLDSGLSLDGSYSRYDSKGSSTGIPDVSYVTDIYELSASYSLSRKIDAFRLSPVRRLKDIRIQAGYSMERYQRTDYTLNNFPDTGTDTFLGIREQDYDLHVFSLSLNLYF